MTFVPLWTRPHHVRQPRRAEVAFLVLHEAPLAQDVPLDPVRFGLPSLEALEGLRSSNLSSEAHAPLFASLREGPAVALAEADLGSGTGALARAMLATSVAGELEDPANLGYLQAAWACVRWMVARGGTLVQDLIGSRWFAAGTLVGPSPSALDVQREVRLVFDGDQTVADPRFPYPGRVLNTRGMKKFGRPDLVAVVREFDAPVYEPIFLGLVQTMAQGWMPGPQQQIDLGQGRMLHLVAEDSPLTQKLALYNDAVVLRTTSGDHPAFAP